MQISHSFVKKILKKFFFIIFSYFSYGIFTDPLLIIAMETKDMMDNTQGWYTLEISGDLDLYSAPELLKKTMEILQQRITHFHVDCSRVQYLDSSGVGTIIKTLQTARARGIKMTFSGIQGTPRKVLSMANILPILTEATPPHMQQRT